CKHLLKEVELSSACQNISTQNLSIFQFRRKTNQWTVNMPNEDREKSSNPPDGSGERRNDNLPEIELRPSTQQEMLATVCLALLFFEKEIEERQVRIQQLNDEFGSLLELFFVG
ncbi:MAG: hypothetical protein ABI977_12120, partial [Acidobacteriota bacterium]